jgi:hypothetical protein
LAIWRRPPAGMGRLVGLLEVVIGLLAILGASIWPDSTAPVAVVVAGAYLAFAAVVAVAIRRGVPSCGCFGRRTAPPGAIHVVTNLVSAVVAGVVAVSATVGVAGADAGVWLAVRDDGAVGVMQAALVALLAWLVVVVDTDGASLAHEVSRARHRRVAR